jgi:hypothetical protein
MAIGLPVVAFCVPFNGLVSWNIYRKNQGFMKKHDFRKRFPFMSFSHGFWLRCPLEPIH